MTGRQRAFGLSDDGSRDAGCISLAPHGLQDGDQITLNLSQQSFGIADSKVSHPLDYLMTLLSVHQTGSETRNNGG
jgi:hypothetical protein